MGLSETGQRCLQPSFSIEQLQDFALFYPLKPLPNNGCQDLSFLSLGGHFRWRVEAPASIAMSPGEIKDSLDR